MNNINNINKTNSHSEDEFAIGRDVNIEPEIKETEEYEYDVSIYDLTHKMENIKYGQFPMVTEDFWNEIIEKNYLNQIFQAFDLVEAIYLMADYFQYRDKKLNVFYTQKLPSSSGKLEKILYWPKKSSLNFSISLLVEYFQQNKHIKKLNKHEECEMQKTLFDIFDKKNLRSEEKGKISSTHYDGYLNTKLNIINPFDPNYKEKLELTINDLYNKGKLLLKSWKLTLKFKESPKMIRFKFLPIGFGLFIEVKWKELNQTVPTKEMVIKIRTCVIRILLSTYGYKNFVYEAEILGLKELCKILAIKNLFENRKFKEIKEIIESIDKFFLFVGWGRFILPDELTENTIIYIEINKQMLVKFNFLSYCKKEWAYSQESLTYQIMEKHKIDLKEIYKSLENCRNSKNIRSLHVLKRDILSMNLK